MAAEVDMPAGQDAQELEALTQYMPAGQLTTAQDSEPAAAPAHHRQEDRLEEEIGSAKGMYELAGHSWHTGEAVEE
jgi:hypothetical protein